MTEPDDFRGADPGAPFVGLLAEATALRAEAPSTCREDIDRIISAAAAAQTMMRSKGLENIGASPDLRHDLRNYANHIMGYSELLLDCAADEGMLESGPRIEAMRQTGAAAAAAVDAAYRLGTVKAPSGDSILHEEPGRILIVDDEASNRDILQRWLTALGHDTVTAAHGGDALNLIKDSSFDLILLDVLMPGMDGYTFLDRLRGLPGDLNLPVIMISALSQAESVVKCLELGAEDFVTKPFDKLVLRARINAILEKKRLRDELQANLARLEADLIAARRLQSALLPAAFPAETARRKVRIGAVMRPARYVSGDLYDVVAIDETTICFAIGDVSDKGAAAALFMAQTMAHFRGAALRSGRSPGRLLQAVNAALAEGNVEMHFVTMLVGVLDTTRGELRLATAGHDQPYVINAMGAAREAPLPRNIPLGIDMNAHYVERVMYLADGDTLFSYTDGVTEATGADGAFFGRDRMLAEITASSASDPEQLVSNVAEKVEAFATDHARADDITMLALNWRRPQTPGRR